MKTFGGLCFLLTSICCTRAIQNGNDAEIQDYPYTVSVQFYKLHICGGAIVAKNLVLTAARCVYRYKPADLKIRAGSTLRNGDDPNTQEVQVAGNHRHEDFEVMGSYNDIAVLTLQEDLVFNDYVNFIQLYSEEDLPVGITATVTGWGEISTVIGIYPLRLLKKRYTTKGVTWCVAELKTLDRLSMLVDSSFCAGNEDSSEQLNMGDIGAPFAHVDERDRSHKTPKLMGIVSRVQELQVDAIYTDIKKMRNFIESVTGPLA